MSFSNDAKQSRTWLLRHGIFIIAITVLSGCASAIMRTVGIPTYTVSHDPKFYPGTVTDVAFLGSEITPLALLDLPLSFVLDTLLLPVDIYRAVN